MAVLIEGISVVIRVDAIMNIFPGGRQGFESGVPNRTLYADGELVRIGFMQFEDAMQYIAQLETQGLRYKLNGKAEDLVVIHQTQGFIIPCDWAEFGFINYLGDPKKRIAICRLVGSKCHAVYRPDDWVYERSMTARSTFVSTGWAREFLQFLRHENGVDVYKDLRSGEELYLGRTNNDSKPY